MRGAPAKVATDDAGDFSRFITLATVAAVAYSIALPLQRIYGIAAEPTELGPTYYALIALACYLPIQLWLVLSAASERLWRGHMVALGVMAAVILAAMPAIGVGWVGILYVLAALTLVSFPAPWSLILFGLILAAPTPLCFAFGHQEWALYFTVGIPSTAVPLAVGIWLIRLARRLNWARLELADQAVWRERLRIDGQLRSSVGTALEDIASEAQEAENVVANNPAEASSILRTLVAATRSTLAEARRITTQYRETSLRTELETAVALLSAAAIDARIAMTEGSLPHDMGDAERARFRGELARVLVGGIPTPLAIVVSQDEGVVRVALVPEGHRRALEMGDAHGGKDLGGAR